MSLKFVLSQLYEPTIKFKDDADLVEIFALADMLGLQELVDAVITKIVKKLCHNFHKVRLMNNFSSILIYLFFP